LRQPLDLPFGRDRGLMVRDAPAALLTMRLEGGPNRA
jgi:hypothetical protein